MDAAALADLARDVEAFGELVRRRPMIAWRAWHREGARTSQLLTLRELTRTRELVVFGGQRSGKSALIQAATVAMVLGSDHPDAREFWTAHGLDPNRFPRGPGRGWVITRSSADSIRYERSQYEALLPRWGPVHPLAQPKTPRPFHWWNRDSKTEARLQIMVPGYESPAELMFKSEDQGRESFDGDNIRVAHHDEEGETDRVYIQVQSRLVDQNGWQLFSNAPIKGRTWVYDRFELGQDRHVTVRRLFTEDNPYLPNSYRFRRLAADPVKGRGEFVLTKGRVWPQFRRDLHVLPASTRALLPARAPRFRSIDFGTRDPHACLWGCYLKSALELPDGRRLPDGSLVVYREHYRREWTLAQHVEHYRRVEGWVQGEDGRWTRPPEAEVFEITVADPEDAAQCKSLTYDHGIECFRAIKPVLAGLDAVGEWLTPDEVTGMPRLYVLDDCPNCIREWYEYVWLDGDREKPSGKSDHTCDTVRYMVQAVRRWL